MLDLETLNKDQKLAVETIEGPVLVLAGAGSGKTKALTFRLCNILENNNAFPHEILAVTFTNKAATEMIDRVMKLLGNAKYNKTDFKYMGTFHSVCAKILRSEIEYLGYTSKFVIYDQDDSLALIKECFNKLNISTKDISPNAVQSFISSAKNELIGPKEYRNLAIGYFQQIVSQIYPIYQQSLKNNNALDFDDLIMKVIEIFSANVDTLQKYQNLFKYIMVDEYQDTNFSQYKLISTLAQIHKNICVVGDEDQSIYKFRGSDIRNILNFESEFQDVKTIKLERNYRSTKNILNAANSVIKKNKQRLDKKMWTENEDGELIELIKVENEKSEGQDIAKKIKNHINAGSRIIYEEYISREKPTLAVLYRTNAQSRAIEESMIKENISYKLVGGVKFYERKEIKDIMSYLKVVANPKDNISLFRIINVPKRKIGKAALENLRKLCEDYHCNYGEILLGLENVSDSEIRNIGEVLRITLKLFRSIYNLSLNNKIDSLIIEIIEMIRYKEYLYENYPKQEAEERIENLNELISLAKNYLNLPQEEQLSKFLEDLALIESNNEKKQKDNVDYDVTLMSVHGSKGLEFDYVFLAGMEEGIFPHTRSLSDNDELEEERRLAYVALTRAKKKLYIYHTAQRTYFGGKQTNDLSRFVEDIPEELVDKKSLVNYDNYALNNKYSYSTKDYDFDDLDFEKIEYKNKNAKKKNSGFIEGGNAWDGWS